MEVLICFDNSGDVVQAFDDAGCHAYSADVQAPARNRDKHYQDDVGAAIHVIKWDLILMYPPRASSREELQGWWNMAKNQADRVVMEHPVFEMLEDLDEEYAIARVEMAQHGIPDNDATNVAIGGTLPTPALRPSNPVDGRGRPPPTNRGRQGKLGGVVSAMAQQWGAELRDTIQDRLERDESWR